MTPTITQFYNKNQFIIKHGDAVTFQSYASTIQANQLRYYHHNHVA